MEGDDTLAQSVRPVEFDEDKLLLVVSLLRISSQQRTLQLKQILKEFWEAEH